jgi:hypothetical protein
LVWAVVELLKYGKKKGTHKSVIFHPFVEKPLANRSLPIFVLEVFGATKSTAQSFIMVDPRTSVLCIPEI